MKNKQYIKVFSHSIESLALKGMPCPEGATGLSRAIICIRGEEVECFYGQCYFFEEDSAEERMDRLQDAEDKMMEVLRKSESFKSGRYEVFDCLNCKWERTEL